MSDFALIYANLWRKGLRTSLLLFAIFIAFLIFSVLASVHSAFYGSTGDSTQNRLVTVNRINFTETLPEAHFNRVQSIEGVDAITHASWFGGYYQEPKNFIQTFAVEPESYLDVHPEVILSDKERQDWLNDRSGVIIGEALASSYGWEVGQQIPLLSNIWQRDDQTFLWTLNISGIFTGQDPTAPTNYALLHYDNFNEPKAFARDQIGQLIMRVSSPELMETLPGVIDEQFANSAFETETVTEDQFAEGFRAQFGAIGLILFSVIGAAFVAILLIVGNTMVMAVRERTREIAVMKTLGFPNPRIFRIVLGESILLATMGGALGIAAGWALVTASSEQAEVFLPGLAISGSIIAIGIGIMSALGVITGAVPALSAMRLRIIDALSRG